MALDPTAKRINWIATGYAIMTGPVQVPARGNGIPFPVLVSIQAWLTLGVANGFIPPLNGSTPANVVLDTDFAALPTPTAAVNAANFLAGIAVIQGVLATWGSNFATIQSMLP